MDQYALGLQLIALFVCCGAPAFVVKVQVGASSANQRYFLAALMAGNRHLRGIGWRNVVLLGYFGIEHCSKFEGVGHGFERVQIVIDPVTAR